VDQLVQSAPDRIVDGGRAFHAMNGLNAFVRQRQPRGTSDAMVCCCSCAARWFGRAVGDSLRGGDRRAALTNICGRCLKPSRWYGLCGLPDGTP